MEELEEGFVGHEVETRGQDNIAHGIDLEEVIGKSFREEQAAELAFQWVYMKSITKWEEVAKRPELLSKYVHFEAAE
ncbi:hypothetical protein Y1Q_0011338 [Alligator mississippiensis]|uniref:Uncharacterized protein n=1 Tax=Alligator mississippiensis TaxID=8496 RepID=A0A151N880_ALLMI|nr:hypothetical protein Y1Q_0011338 [Alligator mississippiensis]